MISKLKDIFDVSFIICLINKFYVFIVRSQRQLYEDWRRLFIDISLGSR